MGTRIVATNYCVPPDVETSQQVAQKIGRTADWIQNVTGVHSRHVSPCVKDPAILAADAARPVIADYGPPDCLIYCGAIPRQMLPDLSVFVHRELGLKGTAAMSVNTACLSFLSALVTADALIERGVYNRILLCVGELASRGRNFDDPESAALLGDGGAAVLVERCEGDSCIVRSRLETWSEGADLAGLRGGGTMLSPDDPGTQPSDHRFFMMGDQLLRVTIPRLRKFLDQFLAACEVSQDQIQLVVPHQPSGPALQLLSRWGFDEDRTINIVAKYGNCVAASMPMALAIAAQEGRLKRGDKVLLLGTAAGISLGAALVTW
jgi:3-oxoacyl-[acyl-carrier-protein] synthase-3